MILHSRNIGFITVAILTISSLVAVAQDTVIKSGFHRFYYPSGQLSSEGVIRDGKPDGYWKSYYQNGTIKSEGSRKNFELDSLWKFYKEDGSVYLEIHYKSGKKNGIRTSYLDKEIIREEYKNDVKDGYTRYYYTDGKIRQEIPFVKGLEQGLAREYDTEGTVITLSEYKKGFIVDRMRINRRDGNGRKQGKWYLFYPSGTVRMEGSYKDDLKNGYFKEFAENGDLKRILKYIDDQLQPEAEEIQKLEVQKEYYPSGKVKISAMYRNGVQEGLRKEYDSTGKVEKAQMFHNGSLIGEGIVLEDGNRDGPWKEYYEDGSLKAEGTYDKDKQTGKWKFYYQSGKPEQTGSFTKQGKKEGVWKWFYENGQLLREENYRNGLRDGMLSEYNETGRLIQEGEFVSGNEDGPWFEITGDSYIRGSYRDGMRQGMWYSIILDTVAGKTDSIVMYKGNFIDDNPDGKHTWFWDNGKTKEEGTYVTGKKEGDWYRYNYDGTLFMVITYKEGVEIRFDGVKIKPPFEKEED